MSRIAWCLFFFVFLDNSVNAQKISGGTFFEKYLTLRTNPFSFLEKDGGILLGANYRWHPRWSFTVDPTFVFYTIHFNPNGDPFDRPLGIKVKSDIRYHITDFILGFKNVFISPELVWSHIRTLKTTTFGINCVGGQCDYYMTDTYKEIKTEKGAAFKIGMEGHIRKNNENWKLELFLGLGVSYFTFTEKDIPPGGAFMQPPVYEDNLGIIREDEPNITIPGGIKISFRIR